MDIEFVKYIGEIKNDTGQYGKAYLFTIVDKYSFDCILFLHDKIDFVSLHNDEIVNGYNNEQILKQILTKYKRQELLNIDYED